MSFKRLWVIFKARNREFFRDRAAFGWNFLFPFLIIAGFGLMFGGRTMGDYKVGLFPWDKAETSLEALEIPDGFKKLKYIRFVGIADEIEGLEKLRHHKIDLLLKLGDRPYQYWMSDTSPKGYVLEQMFKAGLMPSVIESMAMKNRIEGRPIRYIDWLFPGVLAMNMMFSAFWGVGHTIVRYRKNGTLKRLKATPLTALEYLTAQALSRIFLLMFTLSVVWLGCDLLFDFNVAGAYLNIVLVFLIGSLCLTSLGLIIASRGTSEEFASGVLNFIAWPMMFLSEVWFSLEGAPQWIRAGAQIFPLTHLIRAARKVVQDGAGLLDIGPELGVLLGMSLVFLTIAAALFSWQR